jgi:hypothetical protein
MDTQKTDQVQGQAQYQYQIVHVYEIMENVDKLEGHGAYETVAYVSAEHLAKDVSHSDVRNPRKVIKRPAILLPDGNVFLLVCSSPVDIQTTMEDTVRTIALSKLTPEEKASLGV